ncbi:methylenetetrahydrofolate--tRNA-(uracil(54)-C(5))-methyltransferase (FADH(2)-oxidizing) TrmFO [Desulfovibrio sp. OttesenSCG-928-M14]|nr:methylenetetrahydrofolate--tRNA-(uracil(54)-C(5))-methyltransferase (FADH(2)-oxidizing) TrmFO [Desulfovibrio sp. OttesenSCG-928-M14]
MNRPNIAVIGAGLAGCECALALADRGCPLTLFEMKPHRHSPAHSNPDFAELVCSNSLRSAALDSAVGCLKEEMRQLGSVVMKAAEATRVPAGKALAVDRALFARHITRRVTEHPLISVTRKEVTGLYFPEKGEENNDLHPFDLVIVAAGPLASDDLAASLGRLTGEEHLYFYDAIAPVLDAASVNMDVAFWGGRYNPDDQDYLNCPMDKEEYAAFHQALLEGERVSGRDFEKESHFEGCMPIEALAERGFMTLAFGPLKPVGFTDPRTGKRPFALLQLRAENANKSMFNMVGCQTKLTYGEQKRIFSMIPGLERAEFVRLGSMHRNTFVNAPKTLGPDLSLLTAPHIFVVGQLSGVEGYVESAASGLWLGLHLAARIRGGHLPPPPPESALGALLGHLRTPVKRFQPSNAQFGLMPELGEKAGKAKRKLLYAERAKQAFTDWLLACGDAIGPGAGQEKEI